MASQGTAAGVGESNRAGVVVVGIVVGVDRQGRGGRMLRTTGADVECRRGWMPSVFEWLRGTYRVCVVCVAHEHVRAGGWKIGEPGRYP